MSRYDLIPMANVNGENMGGICSFVFAPKEWIEVYPQISADSNAATAAATLYAGRSWLAGQCLHDAQEFSEDQQRNEAGSFFLQKLSGVVNKDVPDMSTLMDAARFVECVVIYKDRNGIRKLIGNKDKAMTFTFRMATGTEVKDKTAFYFEFSHESANPAVHYPF